MEHRTNVLLVDGNALLYRAYHAFPKELTTTDGQPIGAVYGFTRILLSALKTLKPTSVAVCFDVKGPTFRHLSYDQYKATRQAMPEDLVKQIQRTHEVVEALEFPVYTAEGYEADDVIGSLACQAVVDDTECRIVILTADQDLIQLVNERVSVYAPASPPKQPVMYTPERVEEKYGFKPKQMIDYKALRGDPSDNIPGVPGIGEVTATKLVQHFGSLEKLYEAIDAGTVGDAIKPAVLAKLQENKESAWLSFKLASIDTKAPVRFDHADSRLELKHPERLIALFRQLGFRSLMNDLPISHKLLSETTDVFSASEPERPAEPAEAKAEETEDSLADQEVAPVLRAMEELGVKVNCAYLHQLEEEFDAELASLKASLIELAGEEFNPDSPQQVGHILYEVLNIPTKFVRKGKTGYTTDASTLQELASAYPIAQRLLNYRELMKLQTTYVRPLQGMADDHLRIHTSYAPDTAPGRVSSRNPNLQNIPVRTDQGRRLRNAFVADEGCLLVGADYSQIQLRIAAHLADDPVMKAVFLEGRDFHAETAARMGVDRHTAKILNFSILFGKGPYGFSQDLGIPVAEAKAYIEQYFKTYTKLDQYLKGLLDTARAQGYLLSPYGRRREFPDIVSSNFQRRSGAEREALSFTIQATEAYILKRAMIRLSEDLRAAGSTARMILTVHDELILEASEKETAETARILHGAMTTAVKVSLPIEASVKHGKNWGEMEPFDWSAAA